MGMRHLFISLWIALAMIAMPLAHAAAMGMNAHGSHHHHHGDSVQADESQCHHTDVPADKQSTSDPDPMCNTYPVCHMGGVLPVSGLALGAPEPTKFSDATTHAPVARNSKPPLAPPRA